MKKQSESLESIPGVRIKMAQALKSIGIHQVSDLKQSRVGIAYQKLSNRGGLFMKDWTEMVLTNNG